MISRAWVDEVRAAMPELPAALRARFESDYGLTAYDAAQLSASRGLAAYFEAVAQALPAGRPSWPPTGSWARSPPRSTRKKGHRRRPGAGARPGRADQPHHRRHHLNKIAREVFGAMWAGENGGQPDAIIEARGLKQISDTGAIGAMIDEVLAANAAIVEEYRAGKQKAFNPGRPDHEGRPRQGQPATGQRPAQAEAGRLTGSALYQTNSGPRHIAAALLAKNGRVDIRLETGP